jgi:hypothetical protein
MKMKFVQVVVVLVLAIVQIARTVQNAKIIDFKN